MARHQSSLNTPLIKWWPLNRIYMLLIRFIIVAVAIIVKFNHRLTSNHNNREFVLSLSCLISVPSVFLHSIINNKLIDPQNQISPEKTTKFFVRLARAFSTIPSSEGLPFCAYRRSRIIVTGGVAQWW